MPFFFKCWYCPTAFRDLKGLVAHFEGEHRDRDEYIIKEFTADRDGMPAIIGEGEGEVYRFTHQRETTQGQQI